MGRPVAHHVIIIHHGDRFMASLLLSAKETHRRAQKHGMQLHSRDIAVTLKRTGSSVLGTARLQHGFGSISFTLAGEKVPSRAGSVPVLIKSELGQHQEHIISY